MTDDLLAALEAATGPDRELSDRVLEALGWELNRKGGRAIRPDGSFICGTRFFPHPTASLDDCERLTPDTWGVDISFSPGGATVVLYTDDDRYAQGEGATINLAWCAALVRLAAKEEGGIIGE